MNLEQAKAAIEAEADNYEIFFSPEVTGYVKGLRHALKIMEQVEN